MSLTQAQLAIMGRIAATPGAPNVVWPDHDGSLPTDPPRWVMQASGGGQRTMGISTATDANPEVTVRVETADGDFGNTNSDLVDLLVSRFQVGDVFDGIEIEAIPTIRPPVPGAVYSVPVTIRARTFF